ncbi:MAG: GNAT family N-acetyltransferase [Deltaproteobacteria bacterium]|jgi:putative acetyltransferase|nr:GNAT family N-acetyltransferase [Deltaproteobacteria bacterium]
MRLTILTESDHEKVIELWDSSVSATHHYISKKDFDFYRTILPEYLLEVDLYGAVDKNNKLKAFMGVSSDKIEMLFVKPKEMGKGYGKFLVNHAINKLGIKKVDVNEQNTKALGFYEKMGFEMVSRSELDGEGLAYPILALKFKD